MKRKRIEPIKSVSLKVPYSDELQRAAEALISEESFDPYELIGRAALASIVSQVASGELDKDKSFMVLKTLAEKKTPAPVQRIEQTTKVDLRMVFAGLVASNDGVKGATLSKARGDRSLIMDKFSMGADLALSEEGRFAECARSGVDIPSEPVEIADIRKGGDGSLGTMELKRELRNED